MDQDEMRESAERDQLWASLRGLRAEIDRLAAGGPDDSERDRQMVRLLAQIVTAELNYRAKRAAPE